MPSKPISIKTSTLKTVVIIAAMLTTTTVTVVMLANKAREVARADVARLIAGTPGLSVGGVDLNPFSGRVTMRDVAFASGSLHVYARTLSLPAAGADVSSFALVTPAQAESGHPMRLAQWPRTGTPDKAAPEDNGGIELKIPGEPAPAKPVAEAPAPTRTLATRTLGTASATDVSVTSGTETLTIKKIELAGTPLSNAELATLLDPTSPETLVARLKKMTASSIVIPLMTSLDKSDGTVSEVKDILLANVVEGRIEAASVASLTESQKKQATETVTKTGAIQASGLDLALLAQLITTQRADDTIPLKTLAKSFSINDVSNVVHDPAGSSTTTIALITEKNVMARALKTDVAKINVAGDPQATARHQKAFADDIFSSFSFGSISVDKFKIAMFDSKDPVEVSLGRVAFENYQDRTFGAFSIRDILVGQTGGKSSVDMVDFANIILPVFDRPSADAKKPTADDMPTISKFDLARFAMDNVVTDADGTSTKVKFNVGHVGLVADQTGMKTPKKGSLVVDNVTFDVPTDTPVGKQFDAMGYGHIDLSGVMDANYDQAAETLLIPKFQISGVDMGSLTLALDLAGFSKNVLSSDVAVSKPAALSILVKRLDLMVANKGLADKALAYKAKQDGTTITEERDAIVVFLSNLAKSLGEGPGVNTIKSALVAFVKDPKTLHIAASSKDGFGAADVAMFTSPDDLLSHLDIKADANQ